MRRFLMVAVVCAWPVLAGTVIEETAIVGAGAVGGLGRLNGTLTIRPSVAIVTPGGWRVETSGVVVRVVRGAFRVELEPNDAAVPANSQYIVIWRMEGAPAREERWTVPSVDAGVVLTVKDVAAAEVLASQMVSCSQISGTCAGAWPVKGDTGAAGSAGAKGDTGAAGAQGAEGPQGAAGAQGAQGATGAQGAEGPQGAAGAQGEAGTPAALSYSADFDGSSATVVVPGASHGLQTTVLTVRCWDSTPAVLVPSSLAVNHASYDLTIVFGTATAGHCVVSR